MLSEFSARDVALNVLERLEARRTALVADPALVDAEVSAALVPLRAAYREAELPAPYFEALEKEITGCLPAAWLVKARRYTDLEKRDFGLWRAGDPVARVTYVFLGLVIGGLCVELPFIPIWEKWFPFVLAIAAFWLPTAQTAFHKRRYARALGDIALQLDKSQPRLDAHFDTTSLLLPRVDDTSNNQGNKP